ncbi:MAG TPA: hypothetical protein VF179_32865, partial [Thermoanaerobaculia bacterium]|nr:hypothetical protein [Thermoanaerobaculia bacterium]
YRTCQNFTGLAARRLNANGVPLGKAINLPMPGRVGNVAGGDVVLAAQGRNFAAAAMISHPSIGPEEGYAGFTTAVLNDKVFGPHRISSFPVSGVVDMAASPAGGYLLLFMGSTDDSPYQALFVQELDARGVPQGQPLALTGADYIGFDGAVASLPDGRWIVVTRAQQVDSGACSERLVGTVVAGD